MKKKQTNLQYLLINLKKKKKKKKKVINHQDMNKPII